MVIDKIVEYIIKNVKHDIKYMSVNDKIDKIQIDVLLKLSLSKFKYRISYIAESFVEYDNSKETECLNLTMNLYNFYNNDNNSKLDNSKSNGSKLDINELQLKYDKLSI